MKKLLPSALFIAAIPMLAADYSIDASHSSAQFSVRHLMVSNTKGDFTKLKGSVSFDEKNPAATRIDATIDVASINTREPKRDEHLKSADFFDTAKYPNMTFVSKTARKQGANLLVTGDLTLHGVTKPVTLTVSSLTPEAKDPWGMLRRGATATAVINRKDFGLTWNKTLETGGVMVGEEVTITIDVEVVRPAVKAVGTN